jgi:hypothetical protein
MKTMNRKFAEFVDTLDYIEVCRINIAPDGSFSVPSEKDGRIAQVTFKTRVDLAKFIRELADRLDCRETNSLANKSKHKG